MADERIADLPTAGPIMSDRTLINLLLTRLGGQIEFTNAEALAARGPSTLQFDGNTVRLTEVEAIGGRG